MISQSKIIDNIYSVAKEKGKRIKDLETAAKLSVGYLSRMRDSDNGPRLSVEALLDICKELNIGVEALMNYSNDSMTGNEKKLVDFMNKLIEDTEKDVLKWDFYPANTYSDRSNCRELVPLYNERNVNSWDRNFYFQLFDKDEKFESVSVRQGVFQTEISYNKNKATVILSSVDYVVEDEHFPGYELVLETCDYVPLCNTIRNCDERFYVVMEKLFNVIYESQNRIHISDEARGIIDGYMNMDKPKRLTIY